MQKIALFAVAAAALIAGTSATAAGAPQVAPGPNTPASLASFEGKKIDLSKDWGAAKSCVVWRAQGVVSCFRSSQERDAAARVLEARATGRVAAASCSTPLDLYQDSDRKGRDLKFYDRGYWQNLSSYSFDNLTSSYWTGACSAHLAENSGGGGYWYPGNTGPNHIENVSIAWNDRISSIFIT